MTIPPLPEIIGSLDTPEAGNPLPLPPLPPRPELGVVFPLTWFLQHAPSPLQYRAIVDVARLPDAPRQALSLVYSHKPALLLAIRQAMDGSWNTRMLTVPSNEEGAFTQVGTIASVRRLLELGWERESPTLISARRILFRLLAEDDDPAFLYEFADGAADAELVHRGRLILREGAASALAQCGYELDPRLRGCAHRIFRRVGDFLDGELCAHPWITHGHMQVLSPEASPPSIHLLHMLAFMPQFRSEHTDFMESLFAYISRPLPKGSVQQLVGTTLVTQDHLVLGDPLSSRNVVDRDVPFALYWLELMARLGFLKRSENWTRLYDRFIGECDRDHVWRPAKEQVTLPTESRQAWPNYPLHSSPSVEGVAADVTFRIGLIGRIAGRPLEIV